MQNKKSKKLSIVVAITMLSVALVGTTAFASSRLYDSVEGIGIEVHCTNPNARGMLRITMLVFQGGTLWTTWRTKGILFRANYDHSSKPHQCTAS